MIVVTGHLQKTGFQLSDQVCKGFLPKVELLKSLENLLDLHLVPLSSRIHCQPNCEYHESTVRKLVRRTVMVRQGSALGELHGEERLNKATSCESSLEEAAKGVGTITHCFFSCVERQLCMVARSTIRSQIHCNGVVPYPSSLAPSAYQ